MLHQPLLLCRLLLPPVQRLVGGRHQVHGQSRLVLAGAGRGHPAGRLFPRLGRTVPGGLKTGNLVLIEVALQRLGAVGRADQGLHPLIPAGLEHGGQVLIDPFVHPQSPRQGFQAHGKRLRQGVPGIHQQQLPGLRLWKNGSCPPFAVLQGLDGGTQQQDCRRQQGRHPYSLSHSASFLGSVQWSGVNWFHHTRPLCRKQETIGNKELQLRYDLPRRENRKEHLPYCKGRGGYAIMVWNHKRPPNAAPLSGSSAGGYPH